MTKVQEKFLLKKKNFKLYVNLNNLNIDINNIITLYEIFDQYEDYYP